MSAFILSLYSTFLTLVALETIEMSGSAFEIANISCSTRVVRTRSTRNVLNVLVCFSITQFHGTLYVQCHACCLTCPMDLERLWYHGL